LITFKEKNMPELAPPETLVRPALQLAPPEAVEPVPVAQADGMVRLDAKTQTDLDKRVTEFVENVLSNDVQTPKFKDRVLAIHNMGTEEIRASANVSNRMLDKPVKAMESNVFDSKSQISKSLVDLRRTVEDLDPARQGVMNPGWWEKVMPFGDKVRSYFLRYQSAQGHINAILQALYRGQDELRKDNAALEQEKMNLWEIMQKLQQYIYVGKRIDSALENRITQIELDSPEKARIVREEMLFYIRQKVQDLLAQLAVSIQGYLAMDMVRKNNLELIKGVDRATTTTVSALRTAVIVAQALANQKLVLDQITALNTTTSNIIEATSQMLRQNSAQVYEQAASSTINMEKLQNAFKNIYETMDAISTYKLNALQTMQQTVTSLSTEIGKAQTYLDRVRSAEVAEVTSDQEFLAEAAVTKRDELRL
jgi:uncharacterized protein YaaN involved in tellurite resistance